MHIYVIVSVGVTRTLAAIGSLQIPLAGSMASNRTFPSFHDRKVRLSAKRGRNYILERLRSDDVSILTLLITKHMEEKEAMQLSFYDDRCRL